MIENLTESHLRNTSLAFAFENTVSKEKLKATHPVERVLKNLRLLECHWI